jgi:hypothetical protein
MQGQINAEWGRECDNMGKAREKAKHVGKEQRRNFPIFQIDLTPGPEGKLKAPKQNISGHRISE